MANSLTIVKSGSDEKIWRLQSLCSYDLRKEMKIFARESRYGSRDENSLFTVRGLRKDTF